MNIPELDHRVGSTERVFAVHVNDLNDFYLQRHTDLEPLLKLGDNLYNEYSQTLTRPITNSQELDVDHYCACPSESQDWYRGLIRHIDSGEALVYRIDVGDIQRIPLEYLRPLKEKFFKPSRLAFNCSLSNLRKPIGGWPEDIIEEFRECLTKTFLFAQITNYNPIRCLCEVDLTERTSRISFGKDFNRYQQADSLFPINDPMIYQKIEMESLQFGVSINVNILHYISPNRFYVYLPEKLEEYRAFHNELQRSMQIIIESPQLVQYNYVAARDQHLIWHRAILLEIFEDSPVVLVYFVDLGYREVVPIENLQSIPIEYLHPAAMAIPCRLFCTFPLNQTDGAKWSLDDPIHDEFHRLTSNLIECIVMNVKQNVFYDVSIRIPKIGDLCDFLCEQKLASSTIMYTPNGSRQSIRPHVGESRLTTAQLNAGGVPPRTATFQPPSALTQRTNVASSHMASPSRINAPVRDPPGLSAPTRPSTNEVTSKIVATPPSNGPYIITQVHSATEFYGYAVKRENELKALQKRLEDDCNAKANDSVLNCSLFIPGEAFVIQTDNKYERVVLKQRDSDSKVRVKFIDRGDETVLDTSELLPLDPMFQAVPGFAQPFRLTGYEETQNSPMVTKNLKQLILNKTVQITLASAELTSGSYVVDVSINGKSLSDLPLTNNNVASMIPPAPSPAATATATAAAPSTSILGRPFPPANSQNMGPVGSQVYTNSARHPMSSAPTQAPPQRTSAPMNSGNPSSGPPPRAQPGRFGVDQSAPLTSRFGEQTSQQPSRFNAPPSQQNAPTPWNRDNQNNRNNFEGPQGSNYSQHSASNTFQRNNDNNSSTESKRPYGNTGNSRDSQYDQSNRTNNFSNSENNFSNQNNQGFNSNRFNSQNSNDNERSGGGPSNSASSDGFSRQTRGFPSRGHPDQGPDRSSFSRQDSRDGFSNNRGYGDQGSDRSSFNRQDSRDGFSNNRGRRDPPSGGGNGDFSRRYDDNNNRRDFQPRGEYSDRGGRGGRGGRGRGGFENRNQGEFRKPFDNNESSGGFRKPLPMTTSTAPPVPVGTSFPQNVPPKDSFEYVVSNIEEADDFSIQFTAHEDELSTLNNVLQREFGQCPALDLTTLKMDQACLALSADGCWYRATIISTSGIQPKVRFVDFGDSAVVTGQGIRQIAEKHCSKAPYALRCTLADITVLPDANLNKIIDQCLAKKLQGKIVGQTADKRFILQSDQIQQIFIDANAIKKKPSIKLPRHSCSIAQIETDDHEFYIQDDKTTVDKIGEIVENEWKNSATLSIEEVRNLSSDAIIMALFEEVPYRAMIRQEENENDVKVYFVDYGNTDISAKTSLKRCSDELSKYPSQAKRCRLFGISSTKLADAFASLEEKSELESIEFSIVNEKNQIFDVLIYVENECFNEQFGCDLSTIAEEEKSEVPQPTTVETTEVKEEIEPIVSTTSKTHRGLFTHMETERPYVYIQLLPNSEEKLEKINEIIDQTTANPKRISEGHAGDLVIARFTDDQTYYRARIQSFSAESNSYSVYFIDFGNVDDNVANEFVLSYPDELKTIEPQVRGYLLDQIDDKRWHQVVRPFLEAEKLNSEVNFDLIDEQSSIIHLHDLPEDKVEDEDVQAEEKDEPVDEQRKILSGHVSSVENDCFYFQSISSGIDEMNEVLKTIARQNRTDGQWAIGDRCLVVDDDDRLSRGEIVSIEENNEFTVKSFDYGSTKTNRKENQLFLIPDEEIFQREPLAHQCRLQSVDDEHQRQKIEEIPLNQLVEIEIENDQNASCWCVKIRREEQVEQQSDTEKNDENDALNSLQDEHRNEVNSFSVISNNETIDFGEADQPTTIQDETQNEPVPSSST